MRVASKDNPIVSGKTSESGLSVYAISGASFGVYTPIHVLTFSTPRYKIAVGLANHAIDGGEQTPSSVCQAATGCVAAVNGDFYDVSDPGEPVVGDEVGGIIRNCVLLHTPEIAHEQADLDGQSVSNGLKWSSDLDVNGMNVPITAINQELPMTYLHVHVPLAGTLLFTHLYALKTPTATGRVTYEFTQVDRATSPTAINTTSELELVARTTKAVTVAANHVDISAPTGTALATLAVGSTVTLATTSTAGCNNVGGHPILLDNGVVGPISRADTYMATPYARTVIGWTASGETVIMTVGGTDAKSGATMYQLVTLLLSLNVVTALDLDGGTSTSLYANGRVLYPSARAERPVSTSLLVVRNA
ncbi:MAG: phosphodiester glycosidase family protein [Acidimicrobiales bacterium]